MWISRGTRLVVLALTAASCGSGSGEVDAGTDAGSVDAGTQPVVVECLFVKPTVCPTPLPRYAEVQPIFERRCAVCHDDSPGGPWPLTSYQDVADWHDTVRADVGSCAMPPPDSGIEMTDEERIAVLEWFLCGYLK